MMEIEISKIITNQNNPRLEIPDFELQELARSIEEQGVLEPIIVRPNNDKYEIIVGERRYRAAKKAGLVKIPAIIKKTNDRQVVEWNLVENIQREDLTDVEKGKTILKMMDEYPDKYPNITAVSKSLGISSGRVAQWTATAKNLAPEVQKMVVPPTSTGHGKRPSGKISGYTARVIASRIKEHERQIKIAKELSQKKFTHREEQKILSKVAKTTEKPVEEIIKEIEEEPPELIFRYSHMRSIIDGIKIQTSRKALDSKIKKGEIIKANLWQPNFCQLRVKKIERKKLKDFDEEDAKREGGYTLEEFKEVWRSLHGIWNPDETVNIIHFELEKKKRESIQLTL